MLKEYFVGGVVLCFCIVILHAVFWPSDRSFLVNAESNMVDVEQLPFYGIGMGSLIKLDELRLGLCARREPVTFSKAV